MNGRVTDRPMVILRVREFFEKNNLHLKSNIGISTEGYKYPCAEVYYFDYPIRFNPNSNETESLFVLALEDKLEKVAIRDCSSVDEILYNFAKKFGGKNIYDFKSHQNQVALSLFANTTPSSYSPVIKVPDFFN